MGFTSLDAGYSYSSTPNIRAIDAVVTGSMDPDIDKKRLTEAVEHCNQNPTSTLFIQNEVFLDQVINFNAQQCLRGLHADAGFNVISGQFNWGQFWSPLVSQNVIGTIDPTEAFAESFENPTIPVSDGDWVVVYSDDVIKGVTPHVVSNHPQELHQVKGMRGKGYFLDDYIVDGLTKDQRILVMPTLHRVVISDLNLRYSGTQENKQLFNLRRCVNPLMQNVHWLHNGPGFVFWNYCSNIEVFNCSCLGKHNYNTGNGYFHVCGVVNGFVMSDCDVRGVRHLWTTSSGTDIKGVRHGTARNCLIKGNRSGNNGRLNMNYGQIILDTHAEGYGVIFEGNRIELPAEQSNRAGSARARNTIFRNNVVNGGHNNGYGFLIHADDCEVTHNSFRNIWRGVYVNDLKSHAPEGTLVAHNDFTDMAGDIVYQEAGSKIKVIQNTATNVGTINKSCIRFLNGSGHRITLNDLSKHSNTHSIDVGKCKPNDLKVMGNVCDGYGNGVAGFAKSNQGTEFELAYANKNWTD